MPYCHHSDVPVGLTHCAISAQSAFLGQQGEIEKCHYERFVWQGADTLTSVLLSLEHPPLPSLKFESMEAMKKDSKKCSYLDWINLLDVTQNAINFNK